MLVVSGMVASAVKCCCAALRVESCECVAKFEQLTDILIFFFLRCEAHTSGAQLCWLHQVVVKERMDQHGSW